MRLLTLLLLFLNFFAISESFGCCGQKEKKRAQRRIPQYSHAQVPQIIKRDIVLTYQQRINGYCGTTSCHLQNKGIADLSSVTFPTSVQSIHLSRNGIQSISDVSFPLGLKDLYLDNNQLDFSNGITNLSHLTSLHTLSINSNKIRGFQNLYLPQSLKVLSVANNLIHAFSDIENIRDLSSLQVLNLNKNQISIVGNINETLPSSLTILRLSQNGLTDLFTQVPRSLELLDLSNNPLENFSIVGGSESGFLDLANTPVGGAMAEANDPIARLPRLLWDEKVEGMKCGICCEEFANGESVMILPCLHKYHCNCVKQWLERKHTCPDCRHNINVVE